jgi:hypothetical protein
MRSVSIHVIQIVVHVFRSFCITRNRRLEQRLQILGYVLSDNKICQKDVPTVVYLKLIYFVFCGLLPNATKSKVFSNINFIGVFVSHFVHM